MAEFIRDASIDQKFRNSFPTWGRYAGVRVHSQLNARQSPLHGYPIQSQPAAPARSQQRAQSFTTTRRVTTSTGLS